MQLPQRTSGRSRPRSLAGNVFRGSLGNLIEWYDWYAARGDTVGRSIGWQCVYTTPDSWVHAFSLMVLRRRHRLVDSFRVSTPTCEIGHDGSTDVTDHPHEGAPPEEETRQRNLRALLCIGPLAVGLGAAVVTGHGVAGAAPGADGSSAASDSGLADYSPQVATNG